MTLLRQSRLIAQLHLVPLTEIVLMGSNVHGNNVVYTGDTATLEPFKPLLKRGSFLYTEAAYYKSEVHLYLKEMLPEFIKLSDSGVHVYLMHLDVEDKIKELIDSTTLRFVKIYK